MSHRNSFWAFFWNPISCNTAFIFFFSKSSESSVREILPRWTLPRRDISIVFLLPSFRAAAALETSEARRLISWIWVSVTELVSLYYPSVCLTCGLIRSWTACVDPLRDWGWLLVSSGINSSGFSPEGKINFNHSLVTLTGQELDLLRWQGWFFWRTLAKPLCQTFTGMLRYGEMGRCDLTYRKFQFKLKASLWPCKN